MAQGSDEEGPNDVVSASHPLTVETTTTQRKRSTGTLTCPQPELPTLPFDILPEILCRLPVKLLVQLRCLCKFFNSLISDPKFAKKHLQLSTKRHHLLVTKAHYYYDGLVMYDSPLPSLFLTSTVFTQTQLYPPNALTNAHNYPYVMLSCDGIFCGVLSNRLSNRSCYLWNPSIRKFKLLPPLEKPLQRHVSISFGYDCFIDKYKVIVVSHKNEVFVYSLGTDYWTRIDDDIPYDYSISGSGSGIFVNGAVNWLVRVMDASNMRFILSLDLEKESYHDLYLPDFENESSYTWKLGVLRDCLCVIETSDVFSNVWIMKEYGKKESWTKLCTITDLQDRELDAYTALYISEDDQLLVKCYPFDDESSNIKLIVYDSKTDTLNIPEFQNNYEYTRAKVYVESLISP